MKSHIFTCIVIGDAGSERNVEGDSMNMILSVELLCSSFNSFFTRL